MLTEAMYLSKKGRLHYFYMRKRECVFTLRIQPAQTSQLTLPRMSRVDEQS